MWTKIRLRKKNNKKNYFYLFFFLYYRRLFFSPCVFIFLHMWTADVGVCQQAFYFSPTTNFDMISTRIYRPAPLKEGQKYQCVTDTPTTSHNFIGRQYFITSGTRRRDEVWMVVVHAPNYVHKPDSICF